MSEMSRPTPFDRIAGFYNGRVDRFGHDPRSCDYGRRESQTAKFHTLTAVADLRGRRILDVGCGFADYARFLAEVVGPVEYSGIDLSSRMIEEARRISPQLDLHVKNLLALESGAWDVVTANGIFYLLGDDAPRLMEELIGAMYSRARFAVAFNSLSTWASAQDAGEFYADPLQTLALCRKLTPWVVLRHDYLPHDFTVYMYREPQR